MRSPLVVAMLLAAAFTLPGATAAEPLLDDATGDAAVVAGANGAPVTPLPGGAGGYEKASDLVALAITEADDTLAFALTVASLEGDSGLQGRVLVAWGGEDYAVEYVYFRNSVGGAFTEAALLVRQGNDYEYVAELEEPTLDVPSATITAVVPKVYFLDEERRIPGRGDTLQIERVVADTNFADFGFASTRVADSMPDGEGAGASFTLMLGDHSTGSLVMTTPERVRVSNGGATTFVFTIAMRNTAQVEEEYALAAVDLPAGWNATLNSPVKVPPGQEKTVSVLVSVPFAHDHGGYSSFNVSAQSTVDPASSGRMRFGVLHTPIPQPAGHHSDLFLHARDPRSGNQVNEVFATPFPFGNGWMNTQEDHSEDHAFMSPFTQDDLVVWYIFLNPGLQMGLDFDINELGSLEGSIVGNRDGEHDVAAELYWYQGSGDGFEETLLAEGEPTPITLAQQGPAPFKLTLTPTIDADYIAYDGEAGMYLKLTMTGAAAQDQFTNNPLRAQLETATFKMSLPLLEYHDRLTGEADVAQAINIVAKGLVEKVARPGSVLTYPFEVRNDGAPDTFVLDLAGNDVSQATLVPEGEITLGTGESREVTLAVEIPFDANTGQEYEVLLFVHARDDPSKMAIARTKTRATDQADEAMPDEAAQLLDAQARENQTPGPGVALLALALALALALVSRRRR